MQNSSKRFTVRDNMAVIKLIKQKFKPLQNTKQQSIFKKQNNHSQSYHLSKNNNVSLPSLDSHLLNNMPLQDNIVQEKNLLKRVKNYLNGKKRQKSVDQQNLELKKYIQLFEKPVENEIKERQKRQSIEVHMLSNQNFKKNDIFSIKTLQLERQQLTEQERSIFNAKIRRKLNHKKMIELAKRN